MELVLLLHLMQIDLQLAIEVWSDLLNGFETGQIFVIDFDFEAFNIPAKSFYCVIISGKGNFLYPLIFYWGLV